MYCVNDFYNNKIRIQCELPEVKNERLKIV